MADEKEEIINKFDYKSALKGIANDYSLPASTKRSMLKRIAVLSDERPDSEVVVKKQDGKTYWGWTEPLDAKGAKGGSHGQYDHLYDYMVSKGHVKPVKTFVAPDRRVEKKPEGPIPEDYYDIRQERVDNSTPEKIESKNSWKYDKRIDIPDNTSGKLFKLSDQPDDFFDNKVGINRFNGGVARFSKENAALYDSFDNYILDATKELKENGETPDPRIIKSFMLIESGMKPRKNESSGAFGFPQTYQKYIDDINEKTGQHFTAEDMYDPVQAAKYIYYYLKTYSKSSNVDPTNLADLSVMYNFGLGRLGDLKKLDVKPTEKQFPKETRNYIDYMSALAGIFT